MKSILNNVCVSALLCGAVIIATPALAQLTVGAAGSVTGPAVSGSVNTVINSSVSGPMASGRVKTTGSVHSRTSGASGSTGVAVNGDVNISDVANNAASINRSTQNTARRLSRSTAETAAHATESETTRQLNRQATVNAGGSAGAAVQ